MVYVACNASCVTSLNIVYFEHVECHLHTELMTVKDVTRKNNKK